MAAVLDADGLADQHLHMIDVAPVPDRLEQAVCKPQHHDVLHGFFSEVVIDPVDLLLGEHSTDFPIECTGRLEIAPERLLDDDPPPCALLLARASGLAEPPDDPAEQVGGCREIEEDIAAGPMRARDVVPSKKSSVAIYGERFSRQAKGLDIREAVIAPRSPWQNAYAERVIGSIRRECLDHVVVMGERHLRQILSNYVDYYNGTRTHLSLANDAPEPRSVQLPSQGRVVKVPRVGGLHHQYMRRAA